MIVLSTLNFEYLCDRVAARSAISLSIAKNYLVVDRLTPVIRRHEIESLDGLVDRLRRDPKNPLWDEVIDALATNETSFFRDELPFKALSTKVLPSLLQAAEASGSEVRIWSAACSSGQEPYSIAMLVHELAPRSIDRVKIIASDVSKSILERAKLGVYAPLELSRGLSDSMRRRYFRQVGEDNWQVRTEISDMVSYLQFSLVETWPAMQPFDLILLRNVLVYFNDESRRRVLTKAKKFLKPGGRVLLGGAEASPIAREIFAAEHIEGVTFFS